MTALVRASVLSGRQGSVILSPPWRTKDLTFRVLYETDWPMPDEPNPYLLTIARRAFTSQDPSLLQISFDSTVLDRYRGAAGFELIRSNTVGRITKQGGWTLDVGIAEGEDTVHACLHDMLNALPENEREHWAQHIVSLPLSRTFLQMRLSPGSCIEDGEVRAWE